jgi:hypothetical protein
MLKLHKLPISYGISLLRQCQEVTYKKHHASWNEDNETIIIFILGSETILDG